MEAVIEGLLFIAGDEGIAFDKLMETLTLSREDLVSLLEKLKVEYQKETRGITLERVGQRMKLVTKKEHTSYYEEYFSFDNESTLSAVSLEVLAIIAYNMPVTRGMVDEIRGVSSSHLLRKLLAKNLIVVTGKSDSPGKPNLYGVTEVFLDYFGLTDIKDLPSIEVTEDHEEKDLFTSKYRDEI